MKAPFRYLDARKGAFMYLSGESNVAHCGSDRA